MAASLPDWWCDFGEKLFTLSIVTSRPAPSYKIERKKEKYRVLATVGDEGPCEGGWCDTFEEAEQTAALHWLIKYQPNWKYKLDTYEDGDPESKKITASLYSHCEHGNVEGVKAALRRGEDVNSTWQHGACGNPRCTQDPKCDFKATPLQGAIKGNRTDVITLLLQESNIDLNLTTFHKYTALNLACWLDRSSIVRQLLNASGIDPNIPNEWG